MIIHCTQPQKRAYQHYLPVCLKKPIGIFQKQAGFLFEKIIFDVF